ncbi:MAG: hypothetical protein HUU60_01970 [Armatimonadetes bacterium]|nr:hypothetical protein [Armatimonadota bacterium]
MAQIYNEGAVEFRLPDSNKIFYNPRARLGRDIGVLALRAEAERNGRSLTVLELMAGVGLRTRRYLAEAPVRAILANDANPDAHNVLKESLEGNEKAELTNELAQRLLARLYLEDRRFDWVDLDPFGSPSPFFPWCLGAARWDGLLYVTATDAPVLCGAQRSEALKAYDAVAYLGKECHELALRILIGYIQRRMIQWNMHGEPVISFFDGYCWRCLMRARKGAKAFKPELLGFIVQTPDGEYKPARAGIQLGQSEGYPWSTDVVRWIGPLWLGRLHRQEFVADMFKAAREPYFATARRLLARIGKELDEIPITYDVAALADRMDRSVPPTQQIIDYVRNRGYRASNVHHNGRSIRTEAPLSAILSAWDEWHDDGKGITQTPDHASIGLSKLREEG